MENRILIFIREPFIMSVRNLVTGTDWDIKTHKIRVTAQNTTKMSTISCLLLFNTILVKDTVIDFCFDRMHNFSTDKIPAWRLLQIIVHTLVLEFDQLKNCACVCGWFVTVLHFCLFNYVLFTCLFLSSFLYWNSEISVFDIYFPIAPSHGDSHFVSFQIIISRPIFQPII